MVAGELGAGNDLETPEWVPLAEPLPEMAFEADEQIIERYRQTKLEWGLPVDAGFACGVINDEKRVGAWADWALSEGYTWHQLSTAFRSRVT